MPSPASPSEPTPHEAPAPVEASPSSVSFGSILWPVLLSLLVLLGIGYFTFDAEAFWQMWSHLHLGLLGLAVLMTVCRVALGGWRLDYISRGRLGLRAGTRGQLAWEFFSNVTPSTIGGGPVATLYLARDRGITVGEATAFMLFAMLLDQLWFIVSIPLIIGATFFMDVIPPSIGEVGLWTFVAFFVGMMGWSVLFAYATLFRPDLLERLADRIFSFKYLRRFHERVMREMHTLARRARMLRAQPPWFYVKGFLITAAAWASRYLLVLFIVWSVYADFDKVLLLLRTMALTMCSLILPTPGGSGGLEGLYAFFIGPLIPQTLVAPTLLTWRTLGYYVFIALGAYLFIHQMRRSALPAPSANSTPSRAPTSTPVPPESEPAE